jgi:hypothetical protein
MYIHTHTHTHTHTRTQVYELERERDLHTAAMEASREAVEQMRQNLANAEREKEELERAAAQERNKSGRASMECASLRRDLQRLQERFKDMALHGGSGNTNSTALVAQDNGEQVRKQAEEIARLRETVNELTTQLAVRANHESGLEASAVAALQAQVEQLRAQAVQQQQLATGRARDLEQAVAVSEARLEGCQRERDAALAESQRARVEWKELHVSLARARVECAHEGEARRRAEEALEALRDQLRNAGVTTYGGSGSAGGAHLDDVENSGMVMQTPRVGGSPMHRALHTSEQRNRELQQRVARSEIKARTTEKVLGRMLDQRQQLRQQRTEE